MPSAERTLRTEAVVLRHFDFGEADRLLVLYSRQEGKIKALAKGVRKVRSRKAGHLQPFSRVNLMLGRGHDFWVVSQADMIESYQPLRDNLLSTAYASYIVELIDRFTYEDGKNLILYSLLVDTLQRIAVLPDPSQAIRYFEIHLLDFLGFRPELNECVMCRNEVKPEDQFFSFQQGGVLCPRCGQGQSFVQKISTRALKFLRYYQRSSFAEVMRTPLPETVSADLEHILNNYLTYLLERKLNSPVFLHEIREIKP